MENKKTAGPAGTNLEMENKKIGYLKPTNFVIFLIFDQGVCTTSIQTNETFAPKFLFSEGVCSNEQEPVSFKE